MNFIELKNIKITLEKYKNFNVDDELYKLALISWVFFQTNYIKLQ